MPPIQQARVRNMYTNETLLGVMAIGMTFLKPSDASIDGLDEMVSRLLSDTPLSTEVVETINQAGRRFGHGEMAKMLKLRRIQRMINEISAP